MIYIIKRDGTREPFNKRKIIEAVNNAFIEVDGVLYEEDTSISIANDTYACALNMKTELSVEQIQNMVEYYLMQSERKDVARSYIRYRYKREAARDHSNDFIQAIAEKINGSNIENQNANVDEASFGGRYGEAADVMMRNYALNFCVSKMAKNNHENNMIYIHDLNSYAIGSHNCLSIPFDDLLAKGFNTRQTDVRPANSINTAFQLIAVIFQLQSLQQFGGVSATHLDWTMVPYVRKSFVKHFINGLKYCEDDGWGSFNKEDMPEGVWERLSENYKYNKKYQTILDKNADSPKWMETLSIEDEYFKECPRAYRYAMDLTVKELKQAVEGMYHNLNTLQSRSGNQLKWMAG